MKVHLHQGQRK